VTPSATEQALIDKFERANHSWVTHPDNAEARQVIADLGWTSEFRQCLFWMFFPTFLIIHACLTGWVVLQWDLRQRKDEYKEAVEFYAKVLTQGHRKAKKNYMSDRYRTLVKLYYHHIWDIWWPVRHVRSYLSTGLIDFWYFWQMCRPIRMSSVFLAYGGTLWGLLRALSCFQPQEASDYRLRIRPDVECKAGPLMYTAWIGMFFWCIVYPISLYKSLYQAIKQKDSKSNGDAIVKGYSLFLNGYRPEFWWWEVLIFTRKTMMYIQFAIPFEKWNTSGRIMVWFFTAVFFSVLQLCARPYDLRCNNLLTHLENHHLAIWVVSSMLICACHFSKRAEATVIMPFIMAVLHITYVLRLSYHMVLSISANIASGIDKDAVRKMRGTKKLIYLIVLKVEKFRIKQIVPYVALSNMYGWICVIEASRSELKVPYIPKGKVIAHLPGGRPALSDAAFVPEKVHASSARRASPKSCQQVCDILMEACIHIMGTNSTFSVSLLDFIIRAACVMRVARKDGTEEVGFSNWLQANRFHDPLKLIEGGEGGKIQETKEGHESEKAIEELATRMEEELRSFNMAVVVQKKKSMLMKSFEAIADAIEKVEDAVEGSSSESSSSEESDALVEELEKRELRELGGKKMTEEEEAVARLAKQNRYRERRLMKCVDMMYSANPFSSGITMEDLQFLVLQLQHISQQELCHWMDLFEDRWVFSTARNAEELHRIAGGFQDKAVDCDETEFADVSLKRQRTSQFFKEHLSKQEVVAQQHITSPTGHKWAKLATKLGRGFWNLKPREMLPAVKRKMDKTDYAQLNKALAEIKQQRQNEELGARATELEISQMRAALAKARAAAEGDTARSGLDSLLSGDFSDFVEGLKNNLTVDPAVIENIKQSLAVDPSLLENMKQKLGGDNALLESMRQNVAEHAEQTASQATRAFDDMLAAAGLSVNGSQSGAEASDRAPGSPNLARTVMDQFSNLTSALTTERSGPTPRFEPRVQMPERSTPVSVPPLPIGSQIPTATMATVEMLAPAHLTGATDSGARSSASHSAWGSSRLWGPMAKQKVSRRKDRGEEREGSLRSAGTDSGEEARL